MAKKTQPMLCGIDVSLESLDIAHSDGVVNRIQNCDPDITRWLASLPADSSIALEATSDYHELVMEKALACGMKVYLINGKQLHHYREALNQRAKTDQRDAQLLLRYLSHEQAQLTPVKPVTGQEKTLWRLLKRRAALVRARKQLQQSLGGLAETEAICDELVEHLNRQMKVVEKHLSHLGRSLGWTPLLKRCQGIPGIGAINALGLVASFHRGEFKRSDQFVAYLGLDVRVRDSGKFKGRRKLTKRGDAEMRRLLYNAAMSFARNPLYKPLYERLREQGRSATAAYVILARKLVRVAFSLLKNGEDFEQEVFRKACIAT